MFLSFFIGLILVLTLYILSNVKVGQAIVISMFMIGITIFCIAVIYHPYRHIMEKYTNIWVRGIIVFLFISALVQFIITQIFTLPWDIGNLSMTSIFSIIIIVLLIDCLTLMYRDMTQSPQKINLRTNLKRLMRWRKK